MSKQVADILRKALEAFGPNGEKWGQGTARIASSDDLCFNVAVYHVTQGNREGMAYFDEANTALRDAGGFRNGQESMQWNDHPKRTFAEIKSVYEKAISEQMKAE